MADTSVKFCHSSMSGAPVLNGVAGAMIGLLDACLVNGFGSGNVDSIVIASGVATVTRSAGHPFEVDSVALIAGATVTGGSINGEQKVLSVTTNTYTFACAGISNQTASGTITHKLAPLGWTKQYSGTNLAVYKSSEVTSTGLFLRVNDTGTTSARVVGYETMSDVDTGISAFPTSTQMSGGLYWPKSNAGDSTSRPWILIGDGRIMYLMVAYSANNGTTSYGLDCVFGDFNATKSPDAYGCLIHGFTSSSFGTAGQNSIDYDTSDLVNPATGLYFARPYTGLGSSATVRKVFPAIFGNLTRSGFGNGSLSIPYPNYADGGIYLTQSYLGDNANSVLRGTSPGFYCSGQSIGSSVFTPRDKITGVTGLSGKKLMAVNSVTGVFFFDITGPWR